MGIIKDYLIKPSQQQSPLLDEIKNTVNQINAMHRWFNSESDADLIEACVYQLESLEHKYRYLLRIAKESGLSCDAFARIDEARSA
ncbi:MAG: DUF2508 family protein [Clostridia bacterium]|nr:DUF2508 family protein [Clostridia bacterium]